MGVAGAQKGKGNKTGKDPTGMANRDVSDIGRGENTLQRMLENTPDANSTKLEMLR